jgi:acyl transferase domain-containing protein/acyl carrier protein
MAGRGAMDLKTKMAVLLDKQLMDRARKRYQKNQKFKGQSKMTSDNQIPSSGDVTGNLQKDVISLTAKALGISIDKLNPEENLSNFGIDSIAITEIMVRISRHFGLSIAPTTFFEAKDLSHLSSILAERYETAIKNHYRIHNSSDKDESSRSQNLTPKLHPMLPASWLIRHKKVNLSDVKGLDNPIDAHIKTHIDQPPQRQVMPLNNQRKQISDQVAIIAMDGVFPKSPDIESLFNNLKAERDCIEQVPTDRWDWRAVYGDPKKGSFTPVKYGGFINGHDLFDASFFNISPKEAELLDPQHRLFMMSVWRLIERAGYAPSSLSGKKVGMFLGINLLDHLDAVNQASIMEAQQMTGLGHAFCPNRLSFLLDIHGPSEVIDTACSSSLVALDRAFKSILYENCEMAIAGGSNLMLSPKQHILFSKTAMLSKDGRSKTFSKDADGYGRSDGVGALLLKPLSKAEKDGDQILAVIRGSAVQHSGKGSSLTAPNSSAQAKVIIEAHRASGVDPRSIGFIECHGTGTALGDPAEIEGLKLAFNQRFKDYGIENPEDHLIGIGSIKSNIGHTETCAGIAGVIKVLLSLRNKRLFKTIHCEHKNPLIDLDKSPFYIMKDAFKPWQAPRSDEKQTVPRAACVSSFGAGGTNAHVVLEEYLPKHKSMGVPKWLNNKAVIPLSARSKTALRKMAEELLGICDNYEFNDLVYTCQVGRNAMRERLAIVATNLAELKTLY